MKIGENWRRRHLFVVQQGLLVSLSSVMTGIGDWKEAFLEVDLDLDFILEEDLDKGEGLRPGIIPPLNLVVKW